MGNGDGTFRSYRKLATVSETYWGFKVTAGDFNNDGKPDLAGYYPAEDKIATWLGNGSGGFGSPIRSPVGALLRPIAADFNNDGKLDLAGGYGNEEIAVMLGNGNGTFQTPMASSGTGYPQVVSADFNGDGNADLVGSDLTHIPGWGSVLLGRGDGTFDPPRRILDGQSPVSLAVADFNRDGRPDLAVTTNSLSTNLRILLGNGDGTFGPPLTIAVVGGYVASGDWNEDGSPDLVLSNGDSVPSSIVVLIGNGDGTFQSPVLYPAASDPWYLAIADFNGDGHSDVLTADLEANTVSVLLGEGDGTFTPQFTMFGVGPFPTSLTVADLNLDGKPDAAVTSDDVGPLSDIAILMNVSENVKVP